MAPECSLFSTARELDALRRVPKKEATALRSRGDSLLSQGPWTVVDSGDVAPSGDPHDFYTEGPYWWPNPDDPDGPWVKRDGEVNPHAAHRARDDCEKLGSAVVDLAVAALALEDHRYAAKAAELLRAWFIDSATAMNPHLRYGQAIPGKCEGRGIGIIDTRPLISVVEGTSLLADVPEFRRVQDPLRQWFQSFLTWLLTSDHGQHEAGHGNNHSTYYWLQVATYAGFVEDQAAVDEAMRVFKKELIPGQIAEDGSFPREMARTRSYHYASMTLDGFLYFCELGSARGERLYAYRDDRGIGVPNCISFLEPFARGRKPWPNRDIGAEESGTPPWLHLARYRGLSLEDDGFESCNRSRIGPLGALRIL